MKSKINVIFGCDYLTATERKMLRFSLDNDVSICRTKRSFLELIKVECSEHATYINIWEKAIEDYNELATLFPMRSAKRIALTLQIENYKKMIESVSSLNGITFYELLTKTDTESYRLITID